MIFILPLGVLGQISLLRFSLKINPLFAIQVCPMRVNPFFQTKPCGVGLLPIFNHMQAIRAM